MQSVHHKTCIFSHTLSINNCTLFQTVVHSFYPRYQVIADSMATPLLFILKLHCEDFWVLTIFALYSLNFSSLMRQLLGQFIDSLLQNQDLLSHFLLLFDLFGGISWYKLFSFLKGNRIPRSMISFDTCYSRIRKSLTIIDIFNDLLLFMLLSWDSWKRSNFFFVGWRIFRTKNSSFFIFQFHSYLLKL